MVNEVGHDFISVIIRFHDETKIALLDQALFSLANQSYLRIQVVVTLQNGTPELSEKIRLLLERQPFLVHEAKSNNIDPGTSSAVYVGQHIIVSVPVKAGVDGRSMLINEGFRFA